MSNCAKWDNATLWTAGENPVDNAPPRARDSTLSLKDKSLSGDDVSVATLEAVDHLTARIEGLELLVTELLSVVDQPLSPAESLERLRQLKGRL